MSLRDWQSRKWFNWVHGHNLVYNTCWEDPRIDREALRIGPGDNLLVITSAGCNALDYALQGPRRIHAVDMNHRQNALLELKLAGIRALAFDEFFALFGRGRMQGFAKLYEHRLRPALSPHAREYWDRNGRFFSGETCRGSFYFHGTSGAFAWWVNRYLDRRPQLRGMVNALLEAGSVEEQQAVYFGGLQAAFWNGIVRWAVGRDMVLALLGVPRAQREQIERHHAGGIAGFVEECVEAVFAHLPFGDNYFWRVYLTGCYTATCCPEYLREESFLRLKNGLADRIRVHTDTVQGFLEKSGEPISRFVLLDHMDWLSTHGIDLLRCEWQAIVARAAPGARVIWRSGGLRVDYIDPLPVRTRQGQVRVGDLLRYEHALAQDLHNRDRVHTYGSFYIAGLATA